MFIASIPLLPSVICNPPPTLGDFTNPFSISVNKIPPTTCGKQHLPPRASHPGEGNCAGRSTVVGQTPWRGRRVGVPQCKTSTPR